LFQPVAKVSRIDPCGETNRSVILIISKKKTFSRKFQETWASDPLPNGTGDHRAPKFLFRHILFYVVTDHVASHLSPSIRPISQIVGHT
jgi:hypothetical protein